MSAAERIAFETLMEPVAARLLGEPNSGLSKPPRDVRYGTHGSLSVNFEAGAFYDHEAQVGGGVVEFVQHQLGNCPRDTAITWLRSQRLLPGHSTPSPASPSAERSKLTVVAELGRSKIAETYDYVDHAGATVSQTVRYEPKRFSQRRPNGAGGWVWNLDGVALVLYQLPEVIAAVAQGRAVFVVEGEKDVESLRALGLVATTNPMGAGKWRASYSEILRGADVVLFPHNDDAGRKHVQHIAASLRGTAKRVRILDIAAVWPQCPEKGDISDWIAAGGTAEKLNELLGALPEWQAPPQRLSPLSLAEFFSLSIKPREMLLAPIIPEKGTAMLYASRGTGKTHIALGMAYAVATGTKFLKWTAPKPRRVLLIDGEMPAAALQERLANIVAGTKGSEAASEMLKILAGDLIEEGGIGNLALPDVQAELAPALEGVDLLILDNLSSLTAVIRDNDAESWGPIQDWLLRLRRRGMSVLIVHHAGKGGQQRGTSRREDVLDTSISLRRPSDYDPCEGARFEINLEKARGVLGDAAKPFEAKLEVRGGEAIWTTREIDDLHLARVKAMLDDDMSVRDIADELGISKSAVHRLKKKVEAGAGGGTDE
jgi:hypothetical protein